MSHYLAVVLVPRSSSDVKDDVSRLLRDYDENATVPEYHRTCYCVGEKAEELARNNANQKVADVEVLRANFNASLGPTTARQRLDDYDQIEALWRDYIQDWQHAFDLFLEDHPLRNQADPECPNCNGQGYYPTTKNENAKWDWWRIGGRYDGCLFGGAVCQERGIVGDGFNFGPQHETLSLNCRPVRQLPGEILPVAIVTPDGSWHEEDTVGHHRQIPESGKDAWRNEAKRLFSDFHDYLAVACDLHI